ncbi:hypothetical protein DEU38_103165 [Rhodococcus sp. AG1013]|uniref:hypothetical protein n=1 Tax=Rhodococcus sp. AG1013 TaxID=2183996 RepID=UPI000E0C7B13|nr:hypothetical protein [Rhodococcus sp. AG1013]RDI32432.1 hypothetical protein DEU38_103165 [Rhodococcus sp. AG1013]
MKTARRIGHLVVGSAWLATVILVTWTITQGLPLWYAGILYLIVAGIGVQYVWGVRQIFRDAEGGDQP